MDDATRRRMRGKHTPAAWTSATGSATFKEHKRPRFLIPKDQSDDGSTPKRTIRAGSPLRTGSQVVRPVPKFTVTPSTPSPRSDPSSASGRRFLYEKRRCDPSEEIFVDESREGKRVHNPFDVSEDLEEPTVKPTPTKPGHLRFLPPPTKNGTSWRSSGSNRVGADVSSARRFGGTLQLDQGTQGGGGATLSADWSPHKRRLRAGERARFVPGGLAETVALWIYEEQSRNSGT